MLHLSQKSTLIYGFVLLAAIVVLLAFLMFYFLYYQTKKVESVPAKKVQSTIIELNQEILSPNSNNMKGGEEL